MSTTKTVVTKEDALKHVAELEVSIQKWKENAVKAFDDKLKENDLKWANKLSAQGKQHEAEMSAYKGIRDFVRNEALEVLKQDSKINEVLKSKSVPTMGTAEVTLEKVHTVATLKHVKNPIPPIDSNTPQGKVLALVIDGKLDVKRRPAEILAMLPFLSKDDVYNACDALVEKHVLVKMKESSKGSNINYMKDPDLETKVE